MHMWKLLNHETVTGDGDSMAPKNGEHLRPVNNKHQHVMASARILMASVIT